MLMLLQLAAIAAAAPPAIPIPLRPAAPSAAAEVCPNARVTLIEGAPGTAKPRKLNELPPAEAYYAVYRREDGCLTPVKVHERR